MLEKIIVVALVFGICQAQDYNCDETDIEFEPGEPHVIKSINYPLPYPSAYHFCTYTGKAPEHHRLKVSCEIIDFPASSCDLAAFFFSPTGDHNNYDSKQYCNSQNIVLETTGNLFSAFYYNFDSNEINKGFTCTVTAVENKATENCDCGKKREGTRIIGGNEATVNEYPWSASLRVSERYQIVSGRRHFCGASLINSDWVLSAAHCFWKQQPKDTGPLVPLIPIAAIEVRFGEHDQLTTTESVHVSRGVEKIISHQQYDHTTHDNDIALLKLKQPVQFSATVGPVCLPYKYQEDSFTGKTVTAIGWGDKKEGSKKGSEVLMELQLPVMSTADCLKNFPHFKNLLTKNMICTYEKGKDTCQGDSGGPVSYAHGGRHYQVGVVSFGSGCARESMPGVYAKVNNYLPWIQKHTGKAMCNP